MAKKLHALLGKKWKKCEKNNFKMEFFSWSETVCSCHILLWIQLEFCLQYTYYIVNVGKYIVDENVEYMFLCKVWPKNKLGILILSDTLNKYIIHQTGKELWQMG